MKTVYIILLGLSLRVLSGGDAFVINTTMDSTQRDGQVARDGKGNYVAVWQSVSEGDAGDIYLQRFDADDQPVGAEERANNQRAGEQEKVALAMNLKGDFIVAWASHNGLDSIYDVKARYYPAGQSSGQEFLVNATIPHSQTNPDVAIDEEGNFTVVWESWHQDGSDRGIYARRYTADGQPAGGEFRVNTTTTYSQARPAADYCINGDFILIWESWAQDIVTESGYGIFAQRFDSDGNRIGSEFQVNSYTNDYQWFGDLTTLADNGFVVVWTSKQQDGSKGGIYWQRFDANGKRLGGEVPVNQTTYHYQWLPRAAQLKNGDIVVVWSSWNQDGSRDGVYARTFDLNGKPQSFESKINRYTDNFQWEPDVIAGTEEDDFLVVWSSWAQFGMDYEVMARRIRLDKPLGYFARDQLNHIQGRSTAQFKIHVMDSAALSGDSYEVSFHNVRSSAFNMSVTNINSGDTLVNRYAVDKGEDVFYHTPVFDGVSLQVIPEFDFGVDYENSYFSNQSGTNLLFDIRRPTVGTELLAPIDAALIWGATDTLSNGRYRSPLDTAMGYYGDVQTPFKAVNLLNGAPLDLFVAEAVGSQNQKWDVGEKINIFTPPPYQEISSNTHVEILAKAPQNTAPVLPAEKDTHFVFTTRPVKEEDLYQFNTQGDFINNLETEGVDIVQSYRLYQNYPNPFNATTTIPYRLRNDAHVSLNVYNVLGQKVALLVDGRHKAGYYRRLLDASNLASGLYIYVLEVNEQRFARKMLLVK